MRVLHNKDLCIVDEREARVRVNTLLEEMIFWETVPNPLDNDAAIESRARSIDECIQTYRVSIRRRTEER